MPADINTYIGRQAAWHKLGNVTGKLMSTDELLAHPGFQYTVFKSQLRDGQEVHGDKAHWGRSYSLFQWWR